MGLHSLPPLPTKTDWPFCCFSNHGFYGQEG